MYIFFKTVEFCTTYLPSIPPADIPPQPPPSEHYDLPYPPTLSYTGMEEEGKIGIFRQLGAENGSPPLPSSSLFNKKATGAISCREIWEGSRRRGGTFIATIMIAPHFPPPFLLIPYGNLANNLAQQMHKKYR